MIKYLLSLLLLATVSFSATNNRTYTIGSAGDYPTLAAAEADTEQDLVSNDSSITFQFIGGSWADQSATTIDGSISDPTHFMTITAIGDARHNGIWDASGAIRFSASFNPLRLSDDYLVVDGIQSTCTGSASFRNAIVTSGSDGYTIKNCIVKWQNTGASGSQGILATGSTVASYVLNNIVYDVVTSGNDGAGIAHRGKADSCWTISNIIVNCDLAFDGTFLDGVYRNNIVYNCPVFFDGDAQSTNNPSHNNATDLSSINYNCGGCGTGDVTSMSDPFNAIGSDDFSFASGTSDGVEDGSDQSEIHTDANDIIGTSRPQLTNWDIGAFEFISGEPPEDEFRWRRRRLLSEIREILNSMRTEKGNIDYEKDIVSRSMFAIPYTIK